MMFKYPLDGGDILRRKRSLKKEFLLKEGLVSKRVALLSGSTIGEIRNILELFLLDAGIRPEFFEGEYGRYYEELIFGSPALRRFKPDIIYIHSGVRNILNMPAAGDGEETAKERFSAEWARIESVLTAAADYGCPVIVNNFEYPSVRVMGNREAYDAAGKIRFVTELNLKLADFAKSGGSVFINDINFLSAWFGLERWSDAGYYNAYKYALSPDAIPLLCLSAASIIKALFGKNKKALMLDLDDTLWGGVIGEEGVEGIRLGAESPEGMAFADIQRYAKELRNIGVLLGVLSKNERSAAESGFTHPSSVLSKDDFSVFYADWAGKPDNARSAAEFLNIGEDSFVFADDNPAELAFMEQSGAGVETVSSSVPERLPQNLSMSGYFEVVSLSDDDLKRADMYRENGRRDAERGRFADYGGYLKSLEMKVYFSDFTPAKQQRVTQLANKTNQFNPTTRRYTPDETAAVQADSGYIKIAARLSDKFGDNGIVSELIAKTSGETAEIELFVMSCRVFRRNLEFAVFDEFVRQAKALEIREIRGVYGRTPKNSVVEDLYSELGFTKVSESETGAVYTYLIPGDYIRRNSEIGVFYEEG